MTTECVELDIALMRAAAGRATGVLRTLANEDRLLLLCQLSQGEKSVGELEGLLDVHQPTLSQQLGVLRNEGIVHTRRDGKRIYYSVADDKILALLNTLYQLYCPNAQGAAS
ncbi:MAG: metalloregulator ArsR/SmtB family transcription factor [Burkholderiaceae bacterium]|nr:metalloregulator ArsR/SmtB family transcription factor [Burkholderiaceae bacterium]